MQSSAEEAGSASISAQRKAAQREQEELLQLLYLCPVAILKVDGDGTILLMNPYGSQMLMPLAPSGGKLRNLFELFEPFAPEVGEMARRFSLRSGNVCEEHRIVFPPHRLGNTSAIVSVTLRKVDFDVYVAVLTDVTSAAAREIAIRTSEERMHAVLDGVRDYSICTVDAHGFVTSWNRAAERLDDYRSDETIGRHLDFLVSTAAASKSPMNRRLELALRDGSHDFDGWRVRKDGKQYWASTTISALRGKDGQTLIGYCIVTRDLTEQRRSEDRLRLLAMTDPLTGTLNRRAFLENAKRERARSSGPNDALSVLLLDADFFKAINDEHGHDAGDATLQRIVADCRKEIRGSDYLGRFGGEEFAILLPAATAAIGHSVAERIRVRIEASGQRPGAFACTVSVGVAAPLSVQEPIEETINRADTALYAAKAAGRNRVAVANANAA